MVFVAVSLLLFGSPAFARLYKATDLVGIAAQYRYDKNSNLRKVLDGKGNSTAFTYGPNNEPTGLSWPGGQSASAVYDAAGRMTSTTDERGILTNYLSDNADRLTDVQFPAYPAQFLHLDYDNANRPLAVTDPTGSASFTYDALRKRLTGVTTVLGGRVYSVTYGYYPDGKVQSMVSPAGTTLYFYDAAGRMTSLTSPSGDTTTWGYDHAGRVTRETTTPSGGVPLQTTYTWGVSGQGEDPSTAPAYLRSLNQTINNAPYWSYTLLHSYLGQLLQQNMSGPILTGETNVYSYDSRGRLSSDSEQYSYAGLNYSASGS